MSRPARPRRIAGALAIGGLQLVAFGLLLQVGSGEARADAAAPAAAPEELEVPAKVAVTDPADTLAALLDNLPAPQAKEASVAPVDADAPLEPAPEDLEVEDEKQGLQKLLPNDAVMGGY